MVILQHKIEVDEAKVQQRMSDDFAIITLIPINTKSSIITVPLEDTSMSGTFVVNLPKKEKEKEQIRCIASKYFVLCIRRVVCLYNTIYMIIL